MNHGFVLIIQKCILGLTTFCLFFSQDFWTHVVVDPGEHRELSAELLRCRGFVDYDQGNYCHIVLQLLFGRLPVALLFTHCPL